MDPTKKVETEKRLVLGLAALLVVIFITGPVKNMGFFGRRSHTKHAPSVAHPEDSPAKKTRVQTDKVKTVHQPKGKTTARGAEPFTTAALYTAHELRDPLQTLLPAPPTQPTPSVQEHRPAPVAEIHPPALQLQGIVWGGKKPRAIINNEVYGMGDAVAGATITSIASGSVSLEFQGTTFSLTLSKGPARGAVSQLPNQR